MSSDNWSLTTWNFHKDLPNFRFSEHMFWVISKQLFFEKDFIKTYSKLMIKNSGNLRLDQIMYILLTLSKGITSLTVFIAEFYWLLIDCNVTWIHIHLVCKRTFNHLAELAKWLSCVVSTYLYVAFDCMLLSCHACVFRVNPRSVV